MPAPRAVPRPRQRPASAPVRETRPETVASSVEPVTGPTIRAGDAPAAATAARPRAPRPRSPTSPRTPPPTSRGRRPRRDGRPAPNGDRPGHALRPLEVRASPRARRRCPAGVGVRATGQAAGGRAPDWGSRRPPSRTWGGSSREQPSTAPGWAFEPVAGAATPTRTKARSPRTTTSLVPGMVDRYDTERPEDEPGRRSRRSPWVWSRSSRGHPGADGRRLLRRGWLLHARQAASCELAATTEVVLEADDVVLAGVAPVLDLDDDQLLVRPRWPSRCWAPLGTSTESPGPATVMTPSIVAVAMPKMITQCSLRYLCVCSESRQPGLTWIRLIL